MPEDKKLVLDEIYLLEDLDVDEISLVEKGCVPDAYFLIRKSADEEGEESETNKAKGGYGYGYGTAYVSVKAIRALFERAMKAAEGDKKKKFEQLLSLFDELFGVKKSDDAEILSKLDSVVSSINSLTEQMAELISAIKPQSDTNESQESNEVTTQNESETGQTEENKSAENEQATAQDSGGSETKTEGGSSEDQGGTTEGGQETGEAEPSQEDEEFVALISDVQGLFESGKLTPEEAAILQESLEVLIQEG